MVNRDVRRLVFIVLLVALAAWGLAVQHYSIDIFSFNFTRGEDDGPLGLTLGLDLQGGVQLIYEAVEEGVTASQMAGVQEKIERRTNAFGVTEPSIQRLGDNRILIQLPGVEDVEEAKRLIGSTGKLEFKERICPDAACTEFSDQDIGLTGELLSRAYASTHPTSGKPIVNLEFNSEGARLFGESTARIANTNNRTAIFLDDVEILAPSARQPILGGQAFIEGPDFTFERVSTIAIQLEEGRLDTPIAVISEQNVDATLGEEALDRSLVAGMIGFGLVVLFMALYYRLPGVTASLALICYIILVMFLVKMVPVTLTLSGIAGFILSIGVAVDANILISERTKEELRTGTGAAWRHQHGLQPSVARHPQQQRRDHDHLRHPLLVRFPIRRKRGHRFRRDALHWRRDQHVHRRHHQPNTSANYGSDAPGPVHRPFLAGPGQDVDCGSWPKVPGPRRERVGYGLCR